MSIVGTWEVDGSDKRALAELGDVVLEFDENGGLIYVVREADRSQIINLRYRLDGASILTDQPSAPGIERTAYSIEDDVLTLSFGGSPYRFLRGR